MRRLVLLLALAGCADAAAPPPRPSAPARLADAVAALNAAAADAHHAGYKVLLSVTIPDSAATTVGLILYPR